MPVTASNRPYRRPGRSLALSLALAVTTTGLIAAPAQAADHGPAPASETSSSQDWASQGKGADDQNFLERAWAHLWRWGGDDETSTSETTSASADTESSDRTSEAAADSSQGAGATANSAESSTSQTAAAIDGVASASSSSSGEAMPTGDLDGWKQVFADDFTTPVSLGSFPGSASKLWGGYQGTDDTSGAGTYAPQDVLSVASGMLDMSLGTKDGTPVSAAPMPQLDGKFGGWTYGRYSVRFRADAMPGYKVAWLLWPDSANWNEGEIDFPEGDLDGTIQAFNHQVGSPASNALAVDTKASFTDWHTTTIEWTPDGVTFILDGKEVGHSPVSPSTPMHFVLQTETAGGTPPADASGHVQVDWVTMYQQA